MRGNLKLPMLAVLGAALILSAAPDVMAADLDTTVKKVRVAHRGYRAVRDYDGTPVIVRRTRMVAVRDDGVVVMEPRLEHIPVLRATPRTYLNGQPVLPTTRPILQVIAF
jgi:hypothetical protein